MSRLLKQMKTDIFNDVTKATFADRLDHLMEEEKALGDAVYEEYLGNNLKMVNSLPEGYFASHDKVTVVLVSGSGKNKKETFYHRTTFMTTYKSEREIATRGGWGRRDMHLTKPCRIPLDWYHGIYYVKATSALGVQLKKLMDKQEKLFRDAKALQEAVAAALESCTTTKKLQENYPDLAAYLPDTEQQCTSLAVSPVKLKKLMVCAKEDNCTKAQTKVPEVIHL